MEAPIGEKEEEKKDVHAEAIPTELAIQGSDEAKKEKAEGEVKESSTVPQEGERQVEKNADESLNVSGASSSPENNSQSEGKSAAGEGEELVAKQSKEEQPLSNVASGESEVKDEVSSDKNQPEELSKVESAQQAAEAGEEKGKIASEGGEKEGEVAAEDVNVLTGSEEKKDADTGPLSDGDKLPMPGSERFENKRHSVSDIVNQWNKNKSPMPQQEAGASDSAPRRQSGIPDLPRSSSSVKDKIKLFGSPEPRKLNSDAIKETIQRERHASVQSEVNERLSSAKMAKYWEVTAEVKKSVVSEQSF